MINHATGKGALVTGGAASERPTPSAWPWTASISSDLDDAGAAAAAVRAEGRTAFAVSCDVSSADSVAALGKTELDKTGHVDVLVNNAGVYPATVFLDKQWEEWQRLMNIQVNALFHTVKACLPGTVDRSRGRMINMSSTTFHFRHPIQHPLRDQPRRNHGLHPLARRRRWASTPSQ